MSDVEDAEAVDLQRKTAAELGRSSAPDNDEDAIQQTELEDGRRVSQPFNVAEQAKELEKDVRPKNDQTTKDYSSNGQDTTIPDHRPLKSAGTIKAPDASEDSKPSEQGIHSLTQSVTDEASRPISEVDHDDDHFDQTEVSSDNSVRGLQHPALIQKSRDHLQAVDHRSGLDDDFEGGDGEIESESGGQSQELHSEELIRRRISSVSERLREGHEEDEEEGEGLSRASHDLQQQSTEVQIDSGGGHRCSKQRSDSEEVSSRQKNVEVDKTVSFQTEGNAVSYLGTLATEPQEHDEESARQPRLGSDLSVYYPEQLDPEEVTNPFSLEDRIRQAREQQDLSLEWNVDNATEVVLLLTESVASDSQPQSSIEEISRSFIPELEKISSYQPTGSSEIAFDTLLVSEVKERRKTASSSDELSEGQDTPKTKTGAGEAVLLGALASGVNRPTWLVIRAVLVALVASLVLLLHVAIKSESLFVLLNVLFLIVVAGGLILLLSWYISEIGLVSIDKQMAELNLTSESTKVESKIL